MQVPLKVSLSGTGVLGVAGSRGRRRRFERRPQQYDYCCNMTGKHVAQFCKNSCDHRHLQKSMSQQYITAGTSRERRLRSLLVLP